MCVFGVRAFVCSCFWNIFLRDVEARLFLCMVDALYSLAVRKSLGRTSEIAWAVSNNTVSHSRDRARDILLFRYCESLCGSDFSQWPYFGIYFSLLHLSVLFVLDFAAALWT